MEAWMRVLKITLTSSNKKRQYSFGDNFPNPNLELDVSIHKYMSSLKDEATIKISNLDYETILNIIDGKYYNVDIYCGYKNSNITKVFNGEVYYISNKLNSLKTHTCIILCTSKLVARYGQTKMDLTFNSSVNMYAAMSFLCRRVGINNANISTQLKRIKAANSSNVSSTITQYLNNQSKNNSSLIINSDSTTGSTVSIFDANKSNNRVIDLGDESISLNGGFPRLTNEGLNITLLPTFDFQCGDTVKINNALIDNSVSSKQGVSKNYSNFFNENGLYMISEIEYELQNRGDSFVVRLQCYNRERISNYIGGVK